MTAVGEISTTKSVFNGIISKISSFFSRNNEHQLKLKEFYKGLTIPRVAWLGDRLEQPIQHFYVDLTLELPNKDNICLEHLFQNVKGTRILIEASPGYGKTTLATKIAYDWADNQKYTNCFEFVFLIPIRELHGRDIKDAILDLVELTGCHNSGQVQDEMDKHMSKMLLILDGLDEVSLNDKDKVLHILYKRELRDMTVLVTCRSGEFNLTPGEFGALFRGLPMKTEWSDKRVLLKGISNENQRDFLTKFLHDTESIDVVIEYLEVLTDPVKELFESPLMLILLAEMVITKEQIGDITLKTNFYKKVINIMIRRSEERQGTWPKENFDVFGVKNSNNGPYKIKLREFGELCFKNIADDFELTFESTDLIQSIHRLGLVISQKTLSNITCTEHFQIVHLSIMEFLAAYYVWEDFQSNNCQFSSRIALNLWRIIDSFGNTSLVVPFLVALMGQKAALLFSIMKNTCLLAKCQLGIWLALTECDWSEDIKRHVLPLLPKKLHNPYNIIFKRFYSSNQHKEMVKLGIDHGMIDSVFVPNDTEMNLPSDVVIPYLFYCFMNETGHENLDTLKNIQCDVFQLGFRSTRKYGTALVKGFTLCANISAKFRILECTVYSAACLNEHLDDVLTKVNIDCLICGLTNNLTQEERFLVIDTTCKVLSKKRVVELRICDVANIELEYILNYCQGVEVLKVLTNSLCTVPMHKLFMNSNKKWQTISFFNGEVVIEDVIKPYFLSSASFNDQEDCNIQDSCNCDTFLFPDTTNGLCVSRLVCLTVLECSSDCLFTLMEEKYSSWFGFQTIGELIISVTEDYSQTKFWNFLSAFENLYLLGLNMYCIIDAMVVEAEIIPSLLQLQTSQLIYDSKVDESEFSEMFLGELAKSLSNNILHFKTLAIGNNVNGEVKNHWLTWGGPFLEVCVDSNSSLNVIEIYYHVQERHAFLYLLADNDIKFEVKNYFKGYDDDDCRYIKECRKNNVFDASFYKIKISLK